MAVFSLCEMESSWLLGLSWVSNNPDITVRQLHRKLPTAALIENKGCTFFRAVNFGLP